MLVILDTCYYIHDILSTYACHYKYDLGPKPFCLVVLPTATDFGSIVRNAVCRMSIMLTLMFATIIDVAKCNCTRISSINITTLWNFNQLIHMMMYSSTGSIRPTSICCTFVGRVFVHRWLLPRSFREGSCPQMILAPHFWENSCPRTRMFSPYFWEGILSENEYSPDIFARVFVPRVNIRLMFLIRYSFRERHSVNEYSPYVFWRSICSVHKYSPPISWGIRPWTNIRPHEEVFVHGRMFAP